MDDCLASIQLFKLFLHLLTFGVLRGCAAAPSFTLLSATSSPRCGGCPYPYRSRLPQTTPHPRTTTTITKAQTKRPPLRTQYWKYREENSKRQGGRSYVEYVVEVGLRVGRCDKGEREGTLFYQTTSTKGIHTSSSSATEGYLAQEDEESVFRDILKAKESDPDRKPSTRHHLLTSLSPTRRQPPKMSNTQVGNVYSQIITDVIDSSRVDFEEGGVDETVLEELRLVRCALLPLFFHSIIYSFLPLALHVVNISKLSAYFLTSTFSLCRVDGRRCVPFSWCEIHFLRRSPAAWWLCRPASGVGGPLYLALYRCRRL